MFREVSNEKQIKARYRSSKRQIEEMKEHDQSGADVVDAISSWRMEQVNETSTNWAKEKKSYSSGRSWREPWCRRRLLVTAELLTIRKSEGRRSRWTQRCNNSAFIAMKTSKTLMDRARRQSLTHGLEEDRDWSHLLAGHGPDMHRVNLSLWVVNLEIV